MTRREFIESQGATCSNWNWCWSFINHSKRFIIFGAWDINTKGKMAMVLSDEWEISEAGRKSPGYPKSIEHIRLVRVENYRLMTFPMEYSETTGGKVKIKGFTPQLTEKKLIGIGKKWYAADQADEVVPPLAEELIQSEKYVEGAKGRVTINAYERNVKARAACIAHHGCKCAVCGFNFFEVYGSLGVGFIHVHHTIPIGRIGSEYQIDPITDLTPVCPNCHAMLHRTEPPLMVDQLRSHLQSQE